MWRRSGTPQNFFLAFIDYLEKLMFIKKLLKQANQKQNNFNICNVWFKKRIKKNNCKYHYQNLDDMIYSSWDIEQKRLKKNCPKKNKKSKFWKDKKNCWRYHHFTHVYQKSRSYDARFLRYWVRQTELFVIVNNFLPFYPTNNLENQKFEKIKWQPYDKRFLRYGVWPKTFFVILDRFFAILTL